MYNTSFLAREKIEQLGFRTLGSNVLIHPSVVLVGCRNISVGDNVRIDPYNIISAGEEIVLGSNVHIAGACFLSGKARIELQDFVGISHGVKILSSSDDFKGGYLNGPTVPENFRNVRTAPVIIERHVIVGANAVILPGTRLGLGATLGALSLAKGEIDAWSIAAGTPARTIGMRDRDGVLAQEARYLASITGSANGADR